MSAVDAFIHGFLFSLTLCFDLGMVNVAILKTGAERGFGPSLLLGLGSCFGDLLYLALALAGVSAVFAYPPVRWTLWLAGSIVLSYLAAKMLRETWKPRLPDASGQPAGPARSPLRDLATGAGLAVASPSSIAWFALAAGPILSGISPQGGSSVWLFAAGFFAAGISWSLAAAWISSLSRAMLGRPAIRLLSLVSALLFLYFAVTVFLDGLRDAIG